VSSALEVFLRRCAI